MPAVRKLTTLDIFLFIPNLIGYTRVVLALASLLIMRFHPKYCTILYCLSCILDALDGYSARKYNQTSSFGAILDMVTDRCTTSSLICYLCVAYPDYAVAFQLLVSLDLASHYMHMYATLTSGSSSHKKVGEKSQLLKLYYTNTSVLFGICAANELFFVALYLWSFDFAYENPWFTVNGQPVTWVVCMGAVTAPWCALKQVINVIQMYQAAVSLAERDVEEKNAKLK